LINDRYGIPRRFREANKDNAWLIATCAYCEERILLKLEVESEPYILNYFPKGNPPSPPQEIPDIVKKIYAECLTCWHYKCARACASMIGATLEEICNEQGAPKDNKEMLGTKISYLRSKDVITERIKNSYEALSWLRNDAIHLNKDITLEDCENGMLLLEEIINEIYTLPLRKREIRDKYKKKK